MPIPFVAHLRPESNCSRFWATTLLASESKLREDFPARMLFLVSCFKQLGLELEAEGSVLDLGCGLGESALHFSHAADYVQVDVRAGVLHEARRKHHNSHPIVCDVRQLPFREQVFQTVLAVSLFEHIPPSDLISTLSQVSMVISIGGQLAGQIPNSRFVIELHSSIPFYHWLPEKVRNFLWPNRRGEFYDLRINDLKAALSNFFANIQVRPYRYPPGITGIWFSDIFPIPFGYVFLASSIGHGK